MVIDEHWGLSGWEYASHSFSLSAIPAVVLAAFLCRGLGKLGVSEVLTFFISTPLLAVVWFYFVGWLFDRRVRKHNKKASVTI